MDSPTAFDDGIGERLVEAVSSAIVVAERQLLSDRVDEEHWVYELEADATIPAEYVILNHFLGTVNPDVERRIANYLLRVQGSHGGWPLYYDGDFDISASVKSYFALKLSGENINSEPMKRAREAILANGGISKCNVFTRVTLALFGFIPWSASPVSRVEIMLAPEWFPIHLNKISYWSRTVTVPLLVLVALRAKAKNPNNVHLDELFNGSKESQSYQLRNPTGHPIGSVFLALDKVARHLERFIPQKLTDKAIGRAVDFITERLNGIDGLGGIFPAIANALMVFDTLGYSDQSPEVIQTRKAIDDLLVFKNGEAYCQPCVSPVWDTGLAAHALLETGVPADRAVVLASCDWLRERQILETKGDWAVRRPDARPGGWPFQFRNDHYPDVDDTAVVVMALHRADKERYKESIDRGVEWILAMQSKNGGWGAFDSDNQFHLLEHVPFADHGALLDPPTADVTARCVSMLAQVGYEADHPAIKRAIEFLKSDQEEDGSWFGRWGTNYIYGTWSVLSALNAVDEDPEQGYFARAADWLESRQFPDGGWGEDCASYWDDRKNEVKARLPSQTAWAVLGLMAAGRVDSPSVRRGIEFLLNRFDGSDGWTENYFNAVRFPKVFYLKYHGYRRYFPLLAIARYRNLMQKNSKRPEFGL